MAGLPGQTGCPAYGFGGTGSSRVGSKSGSACVRAAGAVAKAAVWGAAGTPSPRGVLGMGTVNCCSGAADPLDPPAAGVSLMATTYLAARGTRPEVDAAPARIFRKGVVSGRARSWNQCEEAAPAARARAGPATPRTRRRRA
ncbi:hypothetical protein GCM10009868_02990 [Terrabacter aerolatus]|uniref:Uncharacterized protein n=1 Tax=Terrabacter aerolatus TaxID=422442 RepID=A0A512D666_9MICO|nr:hypothetical protein TAE01_35600 [Terrabacter aerolatus]